MARANIKICFSYILRIIFQIIVDKTYLYLPQIILLHNIYWIKVGTFYHKLSHHHLVSRAYVLPFTLSVKETKATISRRTNG